MFLGGGMGYLQYREYTNKHIRPEKEDFYKIAFGKVGIACKEFYVNKFFAEIVMDGDFDRSFTEHFLFGMSAEKIHEKLKELGFICEINNNENEYLLRHEEFIQDSAALVEKFKKDLIVAYGVDDIDQCLLQPILNIVFDKKLDVVTVKELADLENDFARMLAGAEKLIMFYRKNKK